MNRSVEGAAMQWVHPETTVRRYELRVAGEPAGLLEWGEEGSRARGAYGEETFLFQRFGFLDPHVVVRDGEGKQVARFDPAGGTGGVLTLIIGRHFRWYSNSWRAEWGWLDVGENDAIRFRRSFDVEEKREGSVEIVNDAATHGQTPLLVMLGWYLIIMSSEPVATEW
ncbi:MAG: hypothetical protein KY459_14165 [Acidobacteria bacterium]|nr:hypothetical protein [Acidobacteriota bacterium]